MAAQANLTLFTNDDQAPIAAPKKENLWEIDDRLTAMAEAYDQLDAEGADEAGKALVMNYFGDALADRDHKLESYARLIATKTAAAEIRKIRAAEYQLEADRLVALAKSDVSLVENLKHRLCDFFIAKNLTRIETKYFVFNRQNNGGKRALKFKEGACPEKAPARFVRLVPEWNNDAIREALAAGEKLDFVELAPQSQRVAIR